MNNQRTPRVYAPVLTPFTRDLAPDAERFVGLCRWLVGQGAGLAVFGTNSEANSLTVRERLELLDEVLDAGIKPDAMLPGTGACALPDAIELTREAVRRGCYRVLVLPPFYFRPASEEGLFAYYSRIVDAVASNDLRIYLYHIPQLSGAPITHDLIEKLIAAYPDNVAGIKDSSGDWSNTEAMLKRFPAFEIYPASEALLARALPMGAAGCISATANLQPGLISHYLSRWRETEATPLQHRMEDVRAILQKRPMIPALKAVMAHYASDDNWRYVRPPLGALDANSAEELVQELRATQFDMPGIVQGAAGAAVMVD